jgi:hypothetical protein
MSTHLDDLRRLLGSLERRVLGERRWAERRSDFRERELWGVVDRPCYAYGMLRAADLARYFGKKKVTVCEFGVAQGAGLLNMIELAEQITRETGVAFRIVGFDTGAGLPTVDGYKDHPELWSPGDFPMVDRDALLKRLDGRAEMIFGDLKDTADGFRETLDPEAPMGFVSIDVDIYTGTVSAFRCLTGRPEQYLPVVSMYFDDVDSIFANDWCGGLAAIHELNEAHQWRKIGRDRSVPGVRPAKATDWYQRMYTYHVLDHVDRQVPRKREPLTINAYVDYVKSYTE